MTLSPTSWATKAASFDSPALPFPQVSDVSRPTISSATTAAWSPNRRRTFSTRFALRRFPSDAADAPAVSAVVGVVDGPQARHVASFVPRFQNASVPGDDEMPQLVHVPGNRSRRREQALPLASVKSPTGP